MISNLITSYAPALNFIGVDEKNEISDPFYQGQLDVFCAVYAVLNALKITHKINAILARNILNETIIDLAKQPELFNAVLEQKTDYIFLVDKVLAATSQRLHLNVQKPFTQTNYIPNSEKLLDTCSKWLNSGENHAIVLRYMQYRSPDKKPVNKHWTTVHNIENNTLHFFDCSHKKNVLLQIKLSEYATDPNEITSNCLLYIQPNSIRFIKSTY